MIVGSLGNVVFQVSYYKVMTPEKLKRTTKARYEEHKILNDVARLEYTGRAPLEISLEIKLVKGLNVNVEMEAEKLRRMCNEGEAEYFILGNRVIGDCRFVIESMDEDTEIWSGIDSAVLKVSMRLKEYDYDIQSR